MNSSKASRRNKFKWIRPVVQIFFFVLVLLIVINKSLAESGQEIPFIKGVSLHAICPFGGVESLYSLLTVGNYIQKIHSSALVMMIAVLVTALLFGAVFCGWVCPFGTFQEFIGKIGRKVFKKKYNNVIPEKLDKYLRYIRYFVLGLVLYNTAITAKLVFQAYDPYYALFNFFTNEVAITAYIALFFISVLSLIIERPFCKYFCPFGAILGVFNHIRVFKIRRNEQTCIACTKCDKICPMNIKVSTENVISSHQCISCMECTNDGVCSIPNAIEVSAKLRREVKVNECQ